MATPFLRLKCYKCSSIMRSVARQAGKRSRCPQCQAPLRIPPVGVFKMYNGRKVQAIREPEWDFKFMKDADRQRLAAESDSKKRDREEFIGVATAEETDENMVFEGKPKAKAAAEAPVKADPKANIFTGNVLPDLRENVAKSDTGDDSADSRAAVADDEDPEVFEQVFGSDPALPADTTPAPPAAKSAAPAPVANAEIDSFFDSLGDDDGDPTAMQVTEVSEFELEPLVLEDSADAPEDDDDEIIDLSKTDIDLERPTGTEEDLNQLLAEIEEDDDLELE